MTEPFKIYRIVCRINGKALVSGSDLPHDHRNWAGNTGQWYDRGTWGHKACTFWKSESTVRSHLQNLCHDWVRKSRPHPHPRYQSHTIDWTEPLPGSADWSRLAHLEVQQFAISEFSVAKLNASDFMGIPDAQAA